MPAASTRPRAYGDPNGNGSDGAAEARQSETMPRATVIVPTRNRARLLRQTMASVLAQTYRDFELVICDNASTDDTGDVVASFEDERIRLVRRPHDIGMVDNHRRSLEEEVRG